MPHPETNLLIRNLPVFSLDIFSQPYHLPEDPSNPHSASLSLSKSLNTDRTVMYTSVRFEKEAAVGADMRKIMAGAIPQPEKVGNQSLEQIMGDLRLLDQRDPPSMPLVGFHSKLIGPDWRLWNEYDRNQFIEATTATTKDEQEEIFKKEARKIVTKNQAVYKLPEVIATTPGKDYLTTLFWRKIRNDLHTHTNIGNWLNSQDCPMTPDALRNAPGNDLSLVTSLTQAMPIYIRQGLIDGGLFGYTRTVIDTKAAPRRTTSSVSRASVDYIGNNQALISIDGSWASLRLRYDGKHKTLGQHFEPPTKTALTPFLVVKTDLATNESDILVNPEDVPLDIWGTSRNHRDNLRLGLLRLAGIDTTQRDKVKNPATEFNGIEMKSPRDILEAQTPTFWPAYSRMLAEGEVTQKLVSYSRNAPAYAA